MSALDIGAPLAPKARLPLGGFARVVSAALTAIDVFAEAQRLAAEAQRRYPFAVE
jgi:hypothetical protein